MKNPTTTASHTSVVEHGVNRVIEVAGEIAYTDCDFANAVTAVIAIPLVCLMSKPRTGRTSTWRL